MVDAAAPAHAGSASESQLHRVISWKDAFWVASGVPALVLFSIGGIAAKVGTPSVLVWTLSVIFGFLQAFTYAEIAGLFPNKSGGASVYGAAAWVRILEVHRAAFGLVQLARLDPGARDRLRHRCRLHPERAVRA
jgi:Amino acid permease